MSISETSLILYVVVFFLVGFIFGAMITRLLLRYPFGRKPLTGVKTMIGLKGTVSASTENYLEVKVSSQYWRAEGVEGEKFAVGDRIIVKGADNLTLVVEKLNP